VRNFRKKLKRSKLLSKKNERRATKATKRNEKLLNNDYAGFNKLTARTASAVEYRRA